MKELGLIFDFDGVIVDSERMHHEAFIEVLRPIGVDVVSDERWTRYIGLDDRTGLARMLEEGERQVSAEEFGRLLDAKFALMRQWGREGRVAAVPGAVELIQQASASMPLAVCSASYRQDIATTLERLGVAERFTAIVGRDDVKRSKPDPEGYALAAVRIARAPERCVAIEDSVPGVRAAKGAGLKAIGLTSTGASEDALRAAGADAVIETLLGLGTGAIVTMAGRRDM